MKKLILILFTLITICTSAYSQFESQVNLFRVVVVNTTYSNVYPRFSTLQNAFNSCVDSANAGKYFIINIATATQNITDYTSQWKDSILAHSPNIRLTSFGQAINDSIIGVTIEEFDLIAGILSLNPLTAGDGLYFDSHKYHIRVTNYLGNALYIDGDSLKIRTDATLLFTPNLLGINFKFNNGMISDTGGIGINAIQPLIVSRDTLRIVFSGMFVAGDSVYLNYNEDHFNYDFGVSPAFSLDLDSGLTSGATGIKVLPYHGRLLFNSSKQLTISDLTAGTGLVWSSDALTLLLAQFTLNNASTSGILRFSGDSLQFNYNDGDFEQGLNGLRIRVDTGLTRGSNGLYVNLDWAEIQFNGSGQIETAPELAGDGLVKAGDAIRVLYNEFLTVQNDTLKAKTSYVLTWYDDSLNASMSYVEPFDSTGICVLGTGKIKRVTFTYQQTTGSLDVVTETKNNISVTLADKIRLLWVNGSSEMRLQRWSQSTRTWSNQITLPFTDFADAQWRVIVELYAESQ